MNFFEMLILSKKLAFVDGGIKFYGQSISVYPLQSLMDYMISVTKDPDLAKFIYGTAKDSMLESKQSLTSAYDSSSGAKWITDAINLYGLGKIQYIKPRQFLTGQISLEDSPFADRLKNKVDKPVDRLTAGIISGMISSISNMDYDVIEIKCQALGDPKCIFVVDEKKNLLVQFPTQCGNQLP